MKLFVGIPAYDRKLSVETCRSLLIEQGAAALMGVEMSVCFAPGSSALHYARDKIAHDFLASDADKLVFVDADVAWGPGSLIRLASHDVDFVGGAYRHKAPDETYPVHWASDTGELWADPATGLLEVKALATGFLSLSRDVFRRLAEKQGDRMYDFGPDRLHSFFWFPPGRGEDYALCDEWRETSGKVWLDPELTLSHVDGGHHYTGRIGDLLRARMAADHKDAA